MELNETVRWLLGRTAILLIGAVVLSLVYRIGVTAIHRIVPALITAQATHLPSSSSSADETAKRTRTIEDLLLKLLRVGVLAGLLVLALAVFELWTILAAIVLVIVAIVVATRDVVLDYVMGLLILVEGPYFSGDYIAVSGHPGVEGVVEEIGLRRTLLRDGSGSSHAVSNGYIRLSSNLTRQYSVAVVDLHVLHASDVDRALATVSAVAEELRADPLWTERLNGDTPADAWVTAIGMDGATIRLQQRVATGAQLAVASELRRRLAGAFAAAAIATGRWDAGLSVTGPAASWDAEG